ncbi:hypothetical protein FWD07_01185 [Candidatus Saccharibacteria bacterium]|nr:hypothetical protein [Candidatus Saccharibacteria bacterium]
MLHHDTPEKSISEQITEMFRILGGEKAALQALLLDGPNGKIVKSILDDPDVPPQDREFFYNFLAAIKHELRYSAPNSKDSGFYQRCLTRTMYLYRLKFIVSHLWDVALPYSSDTPIRT